MTMHDPPWNQLRRTTGGAAGLRDRFPQTFDALPDAPAVANVLQTHPATNHRKYVDAYFEAQKDASAVGGSDEWGEGAVGTGSGSSIMTGERNGALQLAGGTSLDGYTYLIYGQNSAPVWSAARHPHFEGRIALTNALPVTDAHVKHIGFTDDWTVANPNNIIAFRATTAASWEAVTRTGGGTATTTTLIAQALNTWYLWVIDVDTKGGRVIFSIYSDAFNPVLQARVIHTATIPTAGLSGGLRAYNTAAQTTSRDISVDYLWLWQYRWDAP